MLVTLAQARSRNGRKGDDFPGVKAGSLVSGGEFPGVAISPWCPQYKLSNWDSVTHTLGSHHLRWVDHPAREGSTLR